MSRDFHELTDEEQDEVGRIMVRAALEALGPRPTDGEDVPEHEIARGVARAIHAAATVRSTEKERLRNLHGAVVSIDAEETFAVGTAFWLWSENVDLNLDAVNAHSVAGSRLVGFARGVAAARAAHDAFYLLNEDCADFIEDGSRVIVESGMAAPKA